MKSAIFEKLNRFMRKLINVTFVFAATFLLISCKSEPDPTIQEVTLKKLVRTWTLNSIELDGVNKKTSSEYNSFKLTIGGTYSASAPDAEYSYSVSGRPQLSPWPSSGKWKFGTGTPQSQIIRDAGTDNEVAITYSLQENPLQLTVSFNYQGNGIASRTSVVKGNWELVFN